jgi:cyclopropane fatty-acyl-phospholipid synthase-like methyltransferase
VTAPPSAPACERNKGPILEVLHREFADRRSVIEIGSGTGRHAVYFAAQIPQLVWQTSDLPENHAGIAAWLKHVPLANARAPLTLDVESADVASLQSMTFDAAFSANTAHIMGIEAVQAMFDLVGRVLPSGGVFCLYGPFNFDGSFSSPSNAEFDASLRRQDPAMGIRNIEDLDEFGKTSKLTRERLYAMPANNHIGVWIRDS